MPHVRVYGISVCSQLFNYITLYCIRVICYLIYLQTSGKKLSIYLFTFVTILVQVSMPKLINISKFLLGAAEVGTPSIAFVYILIILLIICS